MYLIIVVLLLYCILKYDVYNYTPYRKSWFVFILIILILVSGLSYRLGGDGIGYMREFSQYNLLAGLNYNELSNYSGRQPGWVLLVKLCRYIIDDYSFFKLVHATIVNTLFLITIRRYSRFVFTGILFYFILIYFDYNFQVLRQSLAVSVFLGAIPYFEENKWIKYYIICMISALFHESALITFIIPVIKLFGVSRGILPLYFVISMSALLGGGQLVQSIMPTFLQTSIGGKAYHYTSELNTDGIAGVSVNLLMNLIIPYIYLYISFLKKNSKCLGVIPYFVIIYGIIYCFGLQLPIMYRFNQYFQIFIFLYFIEIFSSIIRWINRKYKVNYAMAFIFISLLFLTYRGRMYFLPYGDTIYPSYVQYYPYSSVLFKKTNPTREALFRYM